MRERIALIYIAEIKVLLVSYKSNKINDRINIISIADMQNEMYYNKTKVFLL